MGGERGDDAVVLDLPLPECGPLRERLPSRGLVIFLARFPVHVLNEQAPAFDAPPEVVVL